MPRYLIFAWVMMIASGALARADEKYILKENVSVGQQVHFRSVDETTTHVDTKIDGKVVKHMDQDRRNVLEGTSTVLEVKDGVATAIRVEISPESAMTTEAKGTPAEKTVSPFAGKTIMLRRRADDSVANDFKGSADKEQLHDLNGLLDPDQDDYPDHPVSIGESWEISNKIAKRLEMGPNDQIMAHCRLDSVKMEDGKKVAHITISAAGIQHVDNVIEVEMELTVTGQIDLATGQMYQNNMKGTMKISGKATTEDADGKSQNVEITGTGDTSESDTLKPSTRPAATP